MKLTDAYALLLLFRAIKIVSLGALAALVLAAIAWAMLGAWRYPTASSFALFCTFLARSLVDFGPPFFLLGMALTMFYDFVGGGRWRPINWNVLRAEVARLHWRDWFRAAVVDEVLKRSRGA